MEVKVDEEVLELQSNSSSSSQASSVISKPTRGRKKNVADFKFTTYFKEDHNQPIFGLAFCHHLKLGEPTIFACTGSNRVTLYECQKDEIKCLQCYSDPDIEEVFHTCCWSYEPDTLQPILAVGGTRGIIRIFYPMRWTCPKHFIGHGHAINELKFHPRNPSILLSASKDHSLRLWNIHSNVCIAIFVGVDGHRDEVLGADFDAVGNRIMSCGMDHSLKLWRLDKSPIKDVIQASFTFDPNKSARPFSTVFENFPDFTTRDVHQNYVDCVKWFGNLILSKSCENENSIVCWKPGQLGDDSLKRDSSVSVIMEFKYSGGALFFNRFSVDTANKYMAVGNMYGTTIIWKLEGDELTKSADLKRIECTANIRNTAFSRNGEILICVCDDGTVWRWDRAQ